MKKEFKENKEYIDIREWDNLVLILLKEGDQKKRLPKTQLKILTKVKDGDFEISKDLKNFTTARFSVPLGMSVGRGLYSDSTFNGTIAMKEDTTYRIFHRGQTIAFYLKEINKDKDHFEITFTEPALGKAEDILFPEEPVEKAENNFNSREKQ